MASNYTYSFTEKSSKDLESILNYISYDLSNAKAASDLFNDIFSSIDNICLFPSSSPILDNKYSINKNIRKKIVNNYSLLYLVNEKEKKIIIVRISHTKMNINEAIKMLDI